MSGSDNRPRVVVGVDGSAGSLAALQCVQHAPCPVTVVRSAGDHDHSQTPEMAGAPAAIL